MKQNWKSKVRNVRSTPLVALLALKICVILPIAIYACDVIISLNVLEDYTEQMVEHMKSHPENVSYAPFLELSYRHNHTGTLLKQVGDSSKDFFFFLRFAQLILL